MQPQPVQLVYGAVASVYLNRGWAGVLPLPPGLKTPPPDGYTGYTGADPTPQLIAQWVHEQPTGNVALRMPHGVIGVDVDSYDGKLGAKTLAELETRLGVLPPTWVSSSREDGTGSGIRLFRVPTGLHWRSDAGDDIEILRHDHRYAVVWPSIHPKTKTTYRWYAPGWIPAVTPPSPADLAELPMAWVQDLSSPAIPRKKTPPRTGQPVTDADDFFDPRPELSVDTVNSRIRARLDSVTEHARRGWSRFRDTLRDASFEIGGYVGAEHLTYNEAYTALILAIEYASTAERPVKVNDDDKLWIQQGLEDGEVNPLKIRKQVPGLPLVLGHWATREAATNLPPEFWEQRPYFKSIRFAAHSQGHSADLVLLADLARISSMVDPKLQVDTGLGPDSLNLGVLAIGDPSIGKSSGTQLACKLTPRPTYLIDPDPMISDDPPAFYDMLPIGSGEGIPEAYYGNIRKEISNPMTGKSRWETVRKQVRRNVFFYVDEGEGFLKTSARSGSTVLAVLRTGLFGGGLGQQNGKAETTRLVFQDQYVMGVVIGFQLDSAQPVLKEATLGTPQRFLWVNADDPYRPEEPTEHPGLMPVRITSGPTEAPLTGIITAPPELKRLVWRRRLRLDGPVPTLDGHAYRLQAKIAALLAIRDNRMALTMEDWELAGVVWATSCAVRSTVIEHGRDLAEREAQARDEAAARRAVVVKTAETSGPKAVERVARLVAKWVTAEPGITRRTINQKRCASRDKKYLKAAVDHAQDQDWVTGGEEDGAGFFPGIQIP